MFPRQAKTYSPSSWGRPTPYRPNNYENIDAFEAAKNNAVASLSQSSMEEHPLAYSYNASSLSSASSLSQAAVDARSDFSEHANLLPSEHRKMLSQDSGVELSMTSPVATVPIGIELTRSQNAPLQDRKQDRLQSWPMMHHLREDKVPAEPRTLSWASYHSADINLNTQSSSLSELPDYKNRDLDRIAINPTTSHSQLLKGSSKPSRDNPSASVVHSASSLGAQIPPPRAEMESGYHYLRNDRNEWEHKGQHSQGATAQFAVDSGRSTSGLTGVAQSTAVSSSQAPRSAWLGNNVNHTIIVRQKPFYNTATQTEVPAAHQHQLSSSSSLSALSPLQSSENQPILDNVEVQVDKDHVMSFLSAMSASTVQGEKHKQTEQGCQVNPSMLFDSNGGQSISLSKDSGSLTNLAHPSEKRDKREPPTKNQTESKSFSSSVSREVYSPSQEVKDNILQSIHAHSPSQTSIMRKLSREFFGNQLKPSLNSYPSLQSVPESQAHAQPASVEPALLKQSKDYWSVIEGEENAGCTNKGQPKVTGGHTDPKKKFDRSKKLSLRKAFGIFEDAEVGDDPKSARGLIKHGKSASASNVGLGSNQPRGAFVKQDKPSRWYNRPKGEEVHKHLTHQSYDSSQLPQDENRNVPNTTISDMLDKRPVRKLHRTTSEQIRPIRERGHASDNLYDGSGAAHTEKAQRISDPLQEVENYSPQVEEREGDPGKGSYHRLSDPISLKADHRLSVESDVSRSSSHDSAPPTANLRRRSGSMRSNSSCSSSIGDGHRISDPELKKMQHLAVLNFFEMKTGKRLSSSSIDSSNTSKYSSLSSRGSTSADVLAEPHDTARPPSPPKFTDDQEPTALEHSIPGVKKPAYARGVTGKLETCGSGVTPDPVDSSLDNQHALTGSHKELSLSHSLWDFKQQDKAPVSKFDVDVKMASYGVSSGKASNHRPSSAALINRPPLDVKALSGTGSNAGRRDLVVESDDSNCHITKPSHEHSSSLTERSPQTKVLGSSEFLSSEKVQRQANSSAKVNSDSDGSPPPVLPPRNYRAAQTSKFRPPPPTPPQAMPSTFHQTDTDFSTPKPDFYANQLRQQMRKQYSQSSVGSARLASSKSMMEVKQNIAMSRPVDRPPVPQEAVAPPGQHHLTRSTTLPELSLNTNKTLGPPPAAQQTNTTKPDDERYISTSPKPAQRQIVTTPESIQLSSSSSSQLFSQQLLLQARSEPSLQQHQQSATPSQKGHDNATPFRANAYAKYSSSNSADDSKALPPESAKEESLSEPVHCDNQPSRTDHSLGKDLRKERPKDKTPNFTSPHAEYPPPRQSFGESAESKAPIHTFSTEWYITKKSSPHHQSFNGLYTRARDWETTRPVELKSVSHQVTHTAVETKPSRKLVSVPATNPPITEKTFNAFPPTTLIAQEQKTQMEKGPTRTVDGGSELEPPGAAPPPVPPKHVSRAPATFNRTLPPPLPEEKPPLVESSPASMDTSPKLPELKLPGRPGVTNLDEASSMLNALQLSAQAESVSCVSVSTSDKTTLPVSGSSSSADRPVNVSNGHVEAEVASRSPPETPPPPPLPTCPPPHKRPTESGVMLDPLGVPEEADQPATPTTTPLQAALKTTPPQAAPRTKPPQATLVTTPLQAAPRTTPQAALMTTPPQVAPRTTPPGAPMTTSSQAASTTTPPQTAPTMTPPHHSLHTQHTDNGRVTTKPIQVVVHVRQKSQEEIECEKVAAFVATQIVNDDKQLSDVIMPPPEHKMTTHYMSGLFDVSNIPPIPTFISDRSIRTEQDTANDSNNGTQVSETSIGSPLSSGYTSFQDADDEESLRKRRLVPGTSLQRQKEELEKRIKEKLSILHCEKHSLQLEIAENELLGKEVTTLVEKKVQGKGEFSKFKLYVDELDKVMYLLLKLSGRLARADNAVMALPPDADEKDKMLLTMKRDEASNKHADAKLLKQGIDRRSKQVSTFLQRSLTEEEYDTYQYYIKMKAKLTMEQQDVDDKIKLGDEQLQALKRSMQR